jgi:signal recognition particle subunit SRP54
MNQMRKLGSFQSILGMIPGLSQFSKDDELVSDDQMKRVEAMVLSMTIEERRYPEIIKRSRRERIARGSGTSVEEVNALIKQFQEMQRMMKKMSNSGKRGGRGRGGRGGRGDQLDPNELIRMLGK